MDPTIPLSERKPRIPFLAAAAGLLAAHGAATLHVWVSNRAVARKAEALAAGGYVVVPGGAAIPGLLSPVSALGGGLFFTLTVGAFLTLAFVAMGVAWRRHYGGDRRFLGVFVLFWLGLFVVINLDGFAGIANVHAALTPPLAFFLAARETREPTGEGERRGVRLGVHAVCLGLLAAMGMSLADAHLFSRVRDRLLEHPAGVAVSDFYYRYTLYPAEAFKAPAQERVRILRLDPALPADLAHRLAKTLAARDYLPLAEPGPEGLRVSGDADRLRLAYRGRPILEIPADRFFADVSTVLRDVSREADRFGGLRQLTFLSLQVVCGLFLYALLFFPLRIAAGISLSPIRATMLAGGLACLAAIAALLFFASDPDRGAAAGAIQDALSSDRPERRIAALRRIARRRIDIAGFSGFRELAASPRVAERYWLAKALRHSRSRTSWPLHLALLDDPQINVAYNAYASLGLRGDRRGIPEILRRLPEESRWYVQWYAYGALRRLGWRPSPAFP